MEAPFREESTKSGNVEKKASKYPIPTRRATALSRSFETITAASIVDELALW